MDMPRPAPFHIGIFSQVSPTVALVFSYLAFGPGFRPGLLGAFIFGHYRRQDGP